MTDCEALAIQQHEILEDKYPTPDGSWSIKNLVTFIHSPQIHRLLINDSAYEEREIIYIDHNFSEDEDTD